MDLGFHPATGAIFEGTTSLPHMLNPKPFVTAATMGLAGEALSGRLPTACHIDDWKVLFREDYFDPTGRIRRGRLYITRGASHKQWVLELVRGSDVSLRTFESIYPSELPSLDQSKIRIALGTTGISSTWKVLMIDQLNTSELLLILKSTSLVGLLPEIKLEVLSEANRNTIFQLTEKLADEASHGLPEPIAELSRNLASAVLTSANQSIDPNRAAQDLAAEAKFFEDYCAGRSRTALYTVSHCARTIARLHAEAKSVEQRKSGCRPPTEDDSELALNCVSRILRVIDSADTLVEKLE